MCIHFVLYPVPAVLLATAEESVTEAKREYEAVVEEWRDPDLRAAYGVELLQSIREQAKATLAAAERCVSWSCVLFHTFSNKLPLMTIVRVCFDTCVCAGSATTSAKKLPRWRRAF